MNKDLPVLVGVVEVVLRVLDLTHVHYHHFSINFSVGRENPKFNKNPNKTGKIVRRYEKTMIDRGKFQGGIEKS
jgi:hypothetical protein